MIGTQQQTKSRNAFAARYHSDLAGFVRDCFLWQPRQGPTFYQNEILTELPKRRRVSVRGPHGLGKTAHAAWIVLWFVLTREAAGTDWKVPATASAWRQLTKYLWPEIHKWSRRLDWEKIGWRGPFNPRTELQTLSLKLSHGEAFAVASNQHELIEGAHADSILYLFDEAKAIPDATFDAAEGAFSGAGSDTAQEAFAVAISTPGEPQGRFYDIQRRKAGYADWWVRAVTLAETIEAGRVSREWADNRAAQWGEESALYKNRVLGQFASSDEDGVIPLAWVEAANLRWLERNEQHPRPQLGPLTALGADVGATGDKTVLAPRYDNFIDTLRYHAKEDTMQTAGRVKGILDGNPGAKANVDVIGIGAGVVHRLKEQGCKADGFNASEGAKDARGNDLKDRTGEMGFLNKRAAAWWGMRELLDPCSGENICLPPDDLLTGDLTAPHYKATSGGRYQIESKDDIKKRLGRSTDAGDAVVMAFWNELAHALPKGSMISPAAALGQWNTRPPSGSINGRPVARPFVKR